MLQRFDAELAANVEVEMGTKLIIESSAEVGEWSDLRAQGKLRDCLSY